MNVLSNICVFISLLIILLALSQGAFAFLYASLLFRSHRHKSTGYQPKAAVVLAVRGSDPFLVENMSTVLKQDYPDFTFFAVLDSVEDSAWNDVLRVKAMAPDRVVVMVVDEPCRTCSLKCSALSYALERLDPSYEVVAFIDGDAKPHASWLRELVAPLSDPTVGVVTGNRWYVPSKISFGSMVRYFWNAGAIVQVWLNGLVWGGSMAVRRDVIESTDLIAAMRRSFVDDGAIVQQTRIAGLRAQFIPSVIMPNREDITIKSFTPWSERQLVAARSSGAGWAVVLFHAFAIGLCVCAPVAIALVGSLVRDGQITLFGVAAFVAYWGGAALSTTAIELGMQSVLRRNQVPGRWIGSRALLYYFPSLVLSHFVYFKALAGATIRKQVSWRGIEYRIDSVNEVQMVEYRPYKGQATQVQLESII